MKARAFQRPVCFRFETVPQADQAFEGYLAHPPFAARVGEFLFGTES